MPSPPAAFSPLATTKSRASSSRSGGSSSRITRRPARAATSPTNKMRVTPRGWLFCRLRGGLRIVVSPSRHLLRRLRGDLRATIVRMDPQPGSRVIVPRWVQLVMLPLAVLLAWAVLRSAGPVILLFTIGGLVALLLNPFVGLLRRAGLPRGFAVLVVMLALVCAVTGLGLLLANPISSQVSAFQHSVPGIVDDANASLSDFQDWLDRNGIDVQVAKE